MPTRFVAMRVFRHLKPDFLQNVFGHRSVSTKRAQAVAEYAVGVPIEKLGKAGFVALFYKFHKFVIARALAHA